MSRPVQIHVRAARDILTDKVLVPAGTEGTITAIAPLVVSFEKGYFGPVGHAIQESRCWMEGLVLEDIVILGPSDLVEGGAS